MAVDKKGQEAILESLRSQIKDPFLRDQVFGVCQKNSKYPKDIIVDGALEKAMKIIIDLEGRTHGRTDVQS
jgi:hypothetical protein